MILTIDKEKPKGNSHMWFWGDCGSVVLGITGDTGKKEYLGSYDSGNRESTKVSFNGPALFRKIEDNYKFTEFFALYPHGGDTKLGFMDEAFLVWLEKYGEDKWFKEQGGVKKAVAEIRKQAKV